MNKSGKSLITTIIAALIVFLPAAQEAFGPTAQLIIGSILIGLTAFWKQFFDSATGKWTFTSMKPVMLITNFGGFVVALIAMIRNYLESGGVVIGSPAVLFLVKATIILNAIILALNDLPTIMGVIAGKMQEVKAMTEPKQKTE